MFGNPTSYKVFAKHYETKHSNAGSLLVMLFLPYLAVMARGYSYSNVTVSALIVVYTVVVLPLASGYTSVGALIAVAKRITFVTLAGKYCLLRTTVWRTRCIYQRMHFAYLGKEKIHTLTNQVIFYWVAEKVVCPNKKFATLYVLLMYTTVDCLQKSLKRFPWSRVSRKTTATDLIRLMTFFVEPQIGKAIAVGLLLLVFTVQFNIEAPLSYIALTVVYFILSQYPGVPGEDSPLVETLRGFDLYELEGLEEWWLPTITRVLTTTMSAVLVLLCLLHIHWILAVLLWYINVFVPWRLVMERCWAPLVSQRLTTSQFPLPSLRQLRDRVCPVCLDDMRLLSARVTPCQHILHAYCLRKCIQTFHQCPMCKHHL